MDLDTEGSTARAMRVQHIIEHEIERFITVDAWCVTGGRLVQPVTIKIDEWCQPGGLTGQGVTVPWPVKKTLGYHIPGELNIDIASRHVQTIVVGLVQGYIHGLDLEHMIILG